MLEQYFHDGQSIGSHYLMQPMSIGTQESEAKRVVLRKMYVQTAHETVMHGTFDRCCNEGSALQ